MPENLKPKSYCEFVSSLDKNNLHRKYHDNEYGVMIFDDEKIFERLILEINQAGLNWNTILNKREGFNRAYDNFDIQKIASYKEADIERLLNDAGIIRNKLKIEATIFNAKVVLDLQKEFGSFKEWLDFHHPKEKGEWIKLFKKHFKFTGGEIVNEFLMSLNYLPGAHIDECNHHL